MYVHVCINIIILAIFAQMWNLLINHFAKWCIDNSYQREHDRCTN